MVCIVSRLLAERILRGTEYVYNYSTLSTSVQTSITNILMSYLIFGGSFGVSSHARSHVGAAVLGSQNLRRIASSDSVPPFEGNLLREEGACG